MIVIQNNPGCSASRTVPTVVCAPGSGPVNIDHLAYGRARPSPGPFRKVNGQMILNEKGETVD